MLPLIPTSKQRRSSGGVGRRTTNVPVRALQPHLATPSECLVPHFRGDKPPSSLTHRPTLLALEGGAAGHAQVPPPPPDACLDGFVLLESTGLALPDDVIYIQLPNCRFTKVAENDLVFFTGLLHLDLSENFLDLAPLGGLPALKELRLACNQIRDVYPDDLEPGTFPALETLDLSYNALTIGSVLALGCLPVLRELDLSGNKLKALPASLAEFRGLEKLMLENNKFDDVAVFKALATAPNLREVGLAYNFLWRFPPVEDRQGREGARDGGVGAFKMLETLDVAFNYFATEDNVEAALRLPRLRSLVLYGNPVLGPTGEDPHFIYIEDLAEQAWAAAYGPNPSEDPTEDFRRRTPIEIVTEIPKKRTMKKGQDLGRRQVSYRDFQMCMPERSRDERVGGKLARDWVKEGNKTLFAQAVALARQQQHQQQVQQDQQQQDRSRPQSVGGDELTFLTRPPGEPDDDDMYCNDDGGGPLKSKIADGIVSFDGAGAATRGTSVGMAAQAIVGKVAAEAGLGAVPVNTDLLALRARAGVKSTYACKGGCFSFCTPIDLFFFLCFTLYVCSPASRALSSSLAVGPGDGDDDDAVEAAAEAAAAMLGPGDDESLGYGGGGGGGGGQAMLSQQAAAVPDFLLRRTMTEANALKAPSDLLAMKTAIRALRFAVRHPLTNYYEEPRGDFLAPYDYVSDTAASASRTSSHKAYVKARAVERQHELHGPAVAGLVPSNAATMTATANKAVVPKSRGKTSLKQRAPLVLDGDLGVTGVNAANPATSGATLVQLEQILDTLNTTNLSSHHHRGAGRRGDGGASVNSSGSPLRRPGSSQTGINSLIRMVNQVVTDLA